MRCWRCGRMAAVFTADPASPSHLLCEFCTDAVVTGVTEAEPRPYKAGALHKRGIANLMAGNTSRVVTTDSLTPKQRTNIG